MHPGKKVRAEKSQTVSWIYHLFSTRQFFFSFFSFFLGGIKRLSR